jgi:hypothetical protein
MGPSPLEAHGLIMHCLIEGGDEKSTSTLSIFFLLSKLPTELQPHSQNSKSNTFLE